MMQSSEGGRSRSRNELPRDAVEWPPPERGTLQVFESTASADLEAWRAPTCEHGPTINNHGDSL
jgi:hypothetical protein